MGHAPFGVTVKKRKYPKGTIQQVIGDEKLGVHVIGQRHGFGSHY